MTSTEPDHTPSQAATGRFPGWLTGGADAAVLAVIDLATRRTAAEVVETLNGRDTVVRLAQRYANLGNPQRAGHLFEVMHTVGFNRHAARAGATVRAQVLEWTQGGSQNGPADIRLVDGGRTIAEIQAKLVGRVPGAAREISRPSYRGMGRLVAADRLDDVNNLLDRRLTMHPQGVFFDDYLDARARTSSQLAHESVRGDPIGYQQAQVAASDPIGWANHQVASAVARDVVAASAAAAAAGAVVGALVSAVGETARVRAGETSAGAAIITAAGAAARGAARSGTVGAISASVRTAAATGVLPTALGGGTVPAAMADAVWVVADAGLQLAKGHIDPGEFAARGAAGTIRAGMVWAGGLVGQTVLPVPVLGALVGGVVAQATAALVLQGLQLAIVAARADGTDHDHLALLEAETVTTAATAALIGRATKALGEDQHTQLALAALPALAHIQATLASPDPGKAITELATVTCRHASQPTFTTADEFDLWMINDNTGLVLNPNW
ncbi:hypothetical protein [Pseudofrankia inefficax]|uniref:Uncharacterized protein n=1 Tax=Pseudofrankia inefficax (strain DSM 45817 / CECT 9037 / DDB 130130 / EuI1c) TaxID=298654 RepID=E3J6C1_PSEI1|nr:hypothetical protein [Pseudofrankia inefficax]ADP79548.1 hypothetical protein FraEuI1c_1486 [Pseudofrankia inefficax]